MGGLGVLADGVAGGAEVLAGVCVLDVLDGERGDPRVAPNHHGAVGALEGGGEGAGITTNTRAISTFTFSFSFSFTVCFTFTFCFTFCVTFCLTFCFTFTYTFTLPMCDRLVEHD